MISKYHSYSEYKAESNADWLGYIPQQWTVLRGKYVFKEVNERSESGNEILLSVSEYYGVKPRSESIAEGEHLSRAESLVGYKKCEVNDLVMNIMLAWKRGQGVTKYSGIVSPAYSVYRFFNNANPDFMHYLFRTDLYTGHFKTRSTGVIDSRLRLYPESFFDVSVLLPSIEEQRTIAAFLDYETARIDSLIDKQQRLIELLKEKRQAVISHAVTKGLNPDAPMKDSGVEWLGQVPEHWDVCRLKHIATIQSGIAKGGKDLSGKALISVPMLRVANVQDGFLKLDDIHTILIEEDMLNRYSLRDGDVLMNEGGDNDKLGRGAIWREQIPNCIHQNHVFAIRTAGVEPEWLDMLTRASYAKFYFFSVAKQSTNLASISASNIKETPILVPPQNERFEILEFLEKQLSRFDLLVQRCNNQIYLLKERRTALISAAVTGKIDLRNWSPSNA